MAKPRQRPVLDEATRRFCEEHTVRLLPFVEILAHRSRLPFPIDDLIQEGAKAVFEALPRWDPSRNVKMETWLQPRVMGAMQDYARKFKLLTGGKRSRAERLESLDRARTYTDDGKEVSLLAELADTRGVKKAIDWKHLMRGFSKRERLILIDYFVLDRTMKQIADNFGICESRISQNMMGLLARLRELEAAEGRVSQAVA